MDIQKIGWGLDRIDLAKYRDRLWALVNAVLNFTFMITCIVRDFFLNNQPDALIIQIYPVTKLYMFRASSLLIIRSSLLYIRHWQVSYGFLMTAYKQSQDGTLLGNDRTQCSCIDYNSLKPAPDMD